MILIKKWFEVGKIEGKIEGEKNLVLKLLIKKFNNIPESLAVELQSISDEKIINKIVDSIFEIKSLKDVEVIISGK